MTDSRPASKGSVHPHEYLDLVDENDIVIGRKLRADIYKEGLWNFRVVEGFLVNALGQLWIPRRTAHKVIFPSALDFSVAGHVESGETYDSSFIREAREELNIDVLKTGYRLLGHLTPRDGVQVFTQVYELHSDESPLYNPKDFTECFWLAPQEAIAKIEGGELAKPDLAALIKRFYL